MSEKEIKYKKYMENLIVINPVQIGNCLVCGKEQKGNKYSKNGKPYKIHLKDDFCIHIILNKYE